MCPIREIANTIIYTPPDRIFSETGVAYDDDFAVMDRNNQVKQVKFNVVPLTPTPGTLTIQCDVAGDQTINLSTISGFDSFATMQPDFGTSPTASSPTDTLTFTSSDSSVTITGNATTDTLDFKVANDQGVRTLSAVGTSPNANAATITGTVLNLQPADLTNPGVVTALTQTFGGSKTFSASTTVASAAASIATLGNTSSTALHRINGGIRYTVRTITSNLTIDTTTTDSIIYCNQSGAITITLPVPTSGRVFTIKDISGTAETNGITLVRNASESIEGLATSKLLSTNYGSWTIGSDGTNWWFI